MRRRSYSNLELAYDNGAFFARADLNYTDERFYTYLNQGSVEAYTLLNVGLGYRFRGLGAVEDLVLQADATNLTDEDYISTIDSNGFVNSDPNGTAQTLLHGRAATVLRLPESTLLTGDARGVESRRLGEARRRASRCPCGVLSRTRDT